MKLSKRLTIIFVLATVGSIGLFISFTKTSIKESYTSEISKIKGITNSVIKQFNTETNNLQQKLLLYKDLIEERSTMIQKKAISQNTDIFKLTQRFSSDNIGFKVYLSNNFEVSKVCTDESNISYNQEDLNNIVKELLKEYSGEEFKSEIISYKKKIYNYSIAPVEDITVESSYLLLIDEIDNDFISGFNAKNDTFIKSSQNYEKKSDDIDIITNSGYRGILSLKEDSINAYIPIKTFDEQKEGKMYLVLEEARSVKKKYLKDVNLYKKIFIMFTLVLNVSLYILIRKYILNRIFHINSAVNKIIDSKDLCIRVPIDQHKDELTDLSIDINEMLQSVQSANQTLQQYSVEMSNLANYDALTSMLNRHSLYQMLREFNNNEIEYCIFFIDLDNFKNINDTLGHNVGDEVLRFTANVLKDYSNEKTNIKVARLGGDEFVVVKFGNITNYKMRQLGEEIVNLLNQSFKKNNFFYKIKASIGISTCPTHSKDINTLMQYADIAMYKSKKNGGNNYCVFSDDMLEDVMMEGKLKEGIRNDEIVAFFQPILDLKNNKIVGAEALARWIKHDEIITPNRFISIAKRNGDIVKIDNLMIRKACYFCRSIMDITNEDFQVSVNISNRSLKKDTFLEEVRNVLLEVGLPSGALRLEITEDEIIEDIDYANNLIQKANNLGIQVSLDDFGVGYSSFNYIKTLQVDTIKFDRSLCMYLEFCGKTLGIIRTLIELCHSLDLKVLCEGIELKEQLDLLIDLNCDFIQGYYIAKPMNERNFIEFISESLTFSNNNIY